MGQVALGFKNLLIKAMVFVIMAALLAWALGGTLWPRAQIVDMPAVRFAGQDWFWRLVAGGREGHTYHWTMISDTPDRPRNTAADDLPRFSERIGPIVIDDALFYGGRTEENGAEQWLLAQVNETDPANVQFHVLPDRLALVQQFERIQAGFTVQDAATITRQRDDVLDPPARGTELDDDAEH